MELKDPHLGSFLSIFQHTASSRIREGEGSREGETETERLLLHNHFSYILWARKTNLIKCGWGLNRGTHIGRQKSLGAILNATHHGNHLHMVKFTDDGLWFV